MQKELIATPISRCPLPALFLPHKPIPATNHSLNIPIPDLPSKRTSHIHNRSLTLISRLLPDRFVDCGLGKNPANK